MLNTLPPSPPPLSPAILPRPSRRRGGQPSNRNAFRHGFYSRMHPTPLAKLSNSIDRYRLITAGGSLKALARAVLDLRKQIDLFLHIINTLSAAGDLSLIVAMNKLFFKAISTSRRSKIILHRSFQPIRDLEFVAGHALDLIYYDFWEHRITRDADSFRIEFEKSDLNSIPSWEAVIPPISDSTFPFITPRQWELLAPWVPALSAGSGDPLASSKRCRRSSGVSGPAFEEGRGSPALERSSKGRPPADPRCLLAAIFWKIAHHARWQDLPVGYPSMSTCRRTYRRLFRSGRLFSLYRNLYKDLCTRARLDLTAMLERGFFTITAGIVALRPGLDETWQMRTALLFMQQGYQVLRHIRREIELERRRRTSYFRLPKLDPQGRIRRPSIKPLYVRPLRPEPEFSFTAPDEFMLSPKIQKRR